MRPLTGAKPASAAADKVWELVTLVGPRASDQDFVRVVFRTADDLPRRDGQRVTKKMTPRAERKGEDAGRPLSR